MSFNPHGKTHDGTARRTSPTPPTAADKNVPAVPNFPQIPSALSVGSFRRVVEINLKSPFPRATCYRMIEDGRIRAHRIGTRIIIPHIELESFLKRCRDGERY